MKVAKQDFDKLQVVSPTEGASSGSSAPSRIAATPTAARGVSPSAGEMEAGSRPGTSASRQSKASSGRQSDLPSLFGVICSSKANDSAARVPGSASSATAASAPGSRQVEGNEEAWHEQMEGGIIIFNGKAYVADPYDNDTRIKNGEVSHPDTKKMNKAAKKEFSIKLYG